MSRSLRRERYLLSPVERDREPCEDRQVGVEPDALDATGRAFPVTSGGSCLG